MTGIPLKVAIASFAHTHAASYVSALRTEAMSTSSPRIRTAHMHQIPPCAGQIFAARLGVRYVESYDELFAWRPDAVVIASENSRHRALVERAAREGVHILCEKPLATTVADGNRNGGCLSRTPGSS